MRGGEAANYIGEKKDYVLSCTKKGDGSGDYVVGVGDGEGGRLRGATTVMIHRREYETERKRYTR